MSFSIKSEGLIEYTLALQKINDISLPIAVQEALNEVAKDVKKRTLMKSANQEFDIDKKTFFTANSGYKPYKAKQFNYNINKMHADVGMLKGTKANEKATEQIGNQQTATPIQRGVNPLGNKPQTKAVIDVLSKKPEIMTWNESDREKTVYNYIRGAVRAKQRGAALVIKKTGATGKVMRIKKFEKRKPTSDNPKKSTIEMDNIASYHKGGSVKLRKPRPFLNNAATTSTDEMLEKAFIKAAEKQISKFWKK